MSSKSVFIPKNEYIKCAPSKKFTDGSCYTIESLIKITNAYNNHVDNDPTKIIKINNSKKYLIHELTKRIVECDNDQLCWLNIKWIKKLDDPEINNNTFRPKGPQGRFKWLSTTNINEIMEQYEHLYTDFKFLGAVPYDFEDIPQLHISDINFDNLYETKKKLGMVINLDEHWKRGSHWVALYTDLEKDRIYFFDSYGIEPKKKISLFVKKIALWCYNNHHGGSVNDTESLFMKSSKKNKYEQKMNIYFNKTRHQYKDSECGVYSVNFILRLLNGETFNHICNIITNDDDINECRKTYFRFI
jgi:hypothetical protein